MYITIIELHNKTVPVALYSFDVVLIGIILDELSSVEKCVNKLCRTSVDFYICIIWIANHSDGVSSIIYWSKEINVL